MHELSYCEGLLASALARAGDRRIAAIGVRAGAAHRLSPPAFQHAFSVAAHGTVASDARTELVTTPLEGRCPACGHAFTTPDWLTLCPSCGDADVRLSGGDELVLAWLDYADGGA